MRTRTNNKIGWWLALLSVVVVAAAGLVCLLPMVEEGSDAAGTTAAGNISVNIYDHASTNYAKLAYCEDALPAEMNATEWVHASDGLWYNINEQSDKRGRVLTYGELTTMELDEVRSDLVARYGSGGSEFVIMSVSFNVSGLSNCVIHVTKDEADHTDSFQRSMYVNGVELNAVDVCRIYTISGTGDISPADIHGKYAVDLTINGISDTTRYASYHGVECEVFGYVFDAYGVPIVNASLLVGVETTTDSGTPYLVQRTITTDSTGKYTTGATRGAVFKIYSLNASNYTFDSETVLPYSSGTITGDFEAITFHAQEKTVAVEVKDQSGRPAVGVSVKAEWLLQTTDVAPYERVVLSDGYITVAGPTDSDGRTYFTYIEPDFTHSVKHKLYVYGVDTNVYINSTYNFNVNGPIYSTSNPLPDTLPEDGNKFANESVYNTVVLKAMQSSILVNVRSALDSSSHGGAVLPDVYVAADWYYQTGTTSSGYLISTDPASVGFSGLTERGKCGMYNQASDADGNVVVTYIAPEWDPMYPNQYSYLYVRFAGSSGIVSGFTFSVPVDFVNGSSSILEQASGYNGCTLIDAGAVADSSITSNDVGYTVTGTVTEMVPGAHPSQIIAFYRNDYGESSQVYATFTLGAAHFQFPVKRGDMMTLEILGTGYSFTNSPFNLGTPLNDVNYTSSCYYVVPVCDRSVPVTVAQYTIDGLQPGDSLVFSYTIGGKNVRETVVSDSTSITVNMMGRAGNILSSVTVISADLYLPPIEVGSVVSVTASRIIEKSFVSYVDHGGNIPVSSNVKDGLVYRVYANSQLFTEATTKPNGVAVFEVPDVPSISYTYVLNGVEYPVIAQVITAGQYAGYTGINMKDFFEDAQSIRVTLQYVASSSFNNQEVPTKTYIVADPADIYLDVGTTEVFTAPQLEGFRFSGWFLGGQMIEGTNNQYSCIISVTVDLDGECLTAAYSPLPKEEEKEGIDNTTLVIGLVAIMIAILAFAYVLVQGRRY